MARQRAAHLDALAPILADPRVGATLGGVMGREVVAEMLEGIEREWAEQGFSYWMFFDKATGEAVARGGLRRTTFDGRPEVEVGWTTARTAGARASRPSSGSSRSRSDSDSSD